MSSLHKKLPNIKSLLAFEASARNLNFRHAASELNVTQPSVSHTIRLLEEQLETQLFIRENRGVRLTDDGQTLYEAVRIGFVGIEKAVSSIGRQNRNYVTIAVSTSMATYWLMPQLHDLYRKHRDIKLKILTTDRNVEPDHEVDLTIRRLPEDYQRPNSWLLSKEIVFPVCSPDYLKHADKIETTEDLLNHRLLYHSEHFRRRINWPEYLKNFNLLPPKTRPRLHFNDYQLVLQAALAGEGLAIGWTITSHYLLEENRLIRPTSDELKTRHAFFILAQRNKKTKPEAVEIVQWLLGQSVSLR